MRTTRITAWKKVNKEWPCFGAAICADPTHAYATLLQGKVVDTYSDEQIDEIFQKPVLLDGMALEALENAVSAAGPACGWPDAGWALSRK